MEAMFGWVPASFVLEPGGAVTSFPSRPYTLQAIYFVWSVSAMEATLVSKLDAVRGIIAKLPSALVSYSGGVDSTLVAYLCHEVLGERMLAVTAASPLLPPRDLSRAIAVAKKLDIPFEMLEMDEISLPGFEDNPPERCYLCKRFRLELLGRKAREWGYEALLEGSNLDDASLHRPGRKAGLELGALSPLEEALLGKEEVRAAARRLGLPNWDAPSRPCLATRFPYGMTLDRALLARVDAAEEWLESLGVRQLRVRVEGPGGARIEVEQGDIDRLRGEEVRARLVKKFRGLGFKLIRLDLEGFRSGSMDEEGRDRTCEDLYIEE